MAKKHRKSAHGAPEMAGGSARRLLSRVRKTYREIEPWEAWMLAFAYLAVMTVLTFRYHRVGFFGVETDFYAELIPQAKKILDGRLSPLNYGPKGPVYSFLLTGAYLVVREYFYAGLILNLVSASVFLAALYHLIKSVFNRPTALVGMVAVMVNYTFMSYTYQAGSDMPFMALCALSMAFLFRSGRSRDIAISALFGALAFLTRYNGAFLVMGTVVYFFISVGSVKRRLKRLCLWIVVFTIAGLPWFIPNYIATGNPVKNDNHVNVMLEFYGSGEGVSYENWTDALPREFTGLGDIVRHDPVYFARHLVGNIGRHFVADLTKLTGIRTGFFVILGLILTMLGRPGRKRLSYLSFGVFYFLILTLVFYNERFSLYLLAVYIPFAAWPLTEKRVVGRLGRYSAAPLAVFILLTMTCLVTSTGSVYREIAINPNPILVELKNLGVVLDAREPDKSQKIIARKPHTAHYAGLVPVMFPGDVDTPDDLVQFCREHRVRYILYSGVEYTFRPLLRILVSPGFTHPDLEKAAANNGGIVYRVSGI